MSVFEKVLKSVYAITPEGGKHLWREAKYHVFSRTSSARYWNFAASTCATSAVLTGVMDEEEFWKLVPEAQLMSDLGLMSPEACVVNIGCGIGRIENAICTRVRSIVGLDVSEKMVQRARERVQAPNVEFKVVDGRSLSGIESAAFDLCISFLVFQHMPREFVNSYFRDVARVLKPGGKFFFQIPISSERRSPEPPRNHPFALRWYSVDAVRKMLAESGLTVCDFIDLAESLAKDKTTYEVADRQYFVAVNGA